METVGLGYGVGYGLALQGFGANEVWLKYWGFGANEVWLKYLWRMPGLGRQKKKKYIICK
jgi:hypothetical protein